MFWSWELREVRFSAISLVCFAHDSSRAWGTRTTPSRAFIYLCEKKTRFQTLAKFIACHGNWTASTLWHRGDQSSLSLKWHSYFWDMPPAVKISSLDICVEDNLKLFFFPVRWSCIHPKMGHQFLLFFKRDYSRWISLKKKSDKNIKQVRSLRRRHGCDSSM